MQVVDYALYHVT